MKRRILLGVLIAAVAMCLFAISISATVVTIDDIQYDVYTDENGNNFATVSNKNRGTCSLETVIIPKTVDYEGTTYTVNKMEDYAFAGNSSIVTFVVKPALARFPNSMIESSRNIKKVYVDFSNVTEIGSRAFTFAERDDTNPVEGQEFKFYTVASWEAGSDVEITEVNFDKIVSIGSGAFNNASLKKVTIGKNCKSIGIQTFRFSDLEDVTVESNVDIPYYFAAHAQLKYIKFGSPSSIGGSAFSTNTKVISVIGDLSNCTSIGGGAFIFATQYDSGNSTVQWYNLKGEQVVDLSNVTKIEGSGFASSNVGSAKIIWPKALTSISDQAFRKANINQPIYINAAAGANVEITRWMFDSNPSNLYVYGPGVYRANGIYSAGTTVVSLADHLEIRYDAFQGTGCTLYSKSYTITENNSAVEKELKNAPTVVEIASGTATPYKGCGLVVDLVLADESTVKIDRVVHEYKDSLDMTVCPAGSATIYKCDGCGDTYKETDETFISNTHEYSFENGAILVNLIYENDNYFLGGTMTVKCAFCDAETVPEEKYDSIFEAIGYSMSEEESYIYHEIRVNKEAIKVYEEFSGKTIQYGVVAAVANDGKPLSIDAEGNLITAEQAVAADMTNSIYSKITIKLSGVPAGVGVNCNAFVIVDNTISYLCGNQILEAAETKIIPVPSEE
ncbi:MAG: leucine-rich repeat protein [Clostridia bacterium]|nr:leucine-rich repeat protein [Clostridia bacterium]